MAKTFIRPALDTYSAASGFALLAGRNRCSTDASANKAVALCSCTMKESCVLEGKRLGLINEAVGLQFVTVQSIKKFQIVLVVKVEVLPTMHFF